MTTLPFFVPGNPAPQGSKAYKGHRRSRTTGKDVPVLVESSKALIPWRNAVHGAAAQHLFDQYRGGWAPLDCALAVDVTFVLPRGATVTRPLPTVPPDLDKLLRGLLDGLTDARVWTDDARVVTLTTWKVYEGDRGYPRPGAAVRIATLPHRPGDDVPQTTDLTALQIARSPREP